MYLSQRLFARQLQELRAAGFVSGSLGDCVGPLRDKRIIITFGRPIQHFCYPYGDWNEAVRDLVADAGYQTACTTQPGVNTAGDSPFALKRFTARYPSRNLKAIWARLRTWR
jgi:peptidoglycan/xylan/chitin deacetylase (PgdA/CDA1 family)